MEAGLLATARQPGKITRIFEMGLGTGLNALLTYIEAEKQHYKIYYEAIDPFALEEGLPGSLNYCAQLQRPDLQGIFLELHRCAWDLPIQIAPFFSFRKIKKTLTAYKTTSRFDLIFFDAFAPTFQPELWSKIVFEELYRMLEEPGVLVTYSSKGTVRRTLESVGFRVDKLKGPMGKREMTRAVKTDNTERAPR
jgi:tRNA U34 5-methylaminomethyl-2-thiouridine-forming methyltransferase MnmC